MRRRLPLEQRRRMPDRRTGTCVSLGLERRDPTPDELSIRFIERLDRPHAHVRSPLPREREHRVQIAERVERFAREQQRDLLDVDHATLRIDPLVGRPADVDQQARSRAHDAQDAPRCTAGRRRRDPRADRPARAHTPRDRAASPSRCWVSRARRARSRSNCSRSRLTSAPCRARIGVAPRSSLTSGSCARTIAPAGAIVAGLPIPFRILDALPHRLRRRNATR